MFVPQILIAESDLMTGWLYLSQFSFTLHILSVSEVKLLG